MGFDLHLRRVPGLAPTVEKYTAATLRWGYAHVVFFCTFPRATSCHPAYM
jgi:hypothetical protein